jgi:uracil-DNA glycosylase family 4
MDAKDLLRQYLAQRRELGESEFVLDSLSVEAAMQALGARSTPSIRKREAPPGADDWREALRAAGAAPASSSTPSPAATIAPVADVTAAPPPSGNVPVADRPPSAPAPGAPAPTAPQESIVVGSAEVQLFGGRYSEVTTLDGLAELIRACTLCPLHATAINPVPGEGNPAARLVCVGEAPGATEDETGRPFVGRAGELLTRILEAIDLKREDVFIVNVLKHRPPGNRNPAPDEIVACRPYLMRQLELIRPSVILALGTFAAQTLLETKLAIGKLRGNVHRFYGTPLVVTYHPAALLRNPHWKRPTWEDVKLVRRLLDTPPGDG